MLRDRIRLINLMNYFGCASIYSVIKTPILNTNIFSDQIFIDTVNLRLIIEIIIIIISLSRE